MVFTPEGLFEVAIESWSNRLSYQAMSSTLTQSQLYSYSNFIVCSVSDFISAIAFFSHHVYLN